MTADTASLLKKVVQLDLIQQANFVTNLPPSLNMMVGGVRVHRLGSAINLHIDLIVPATLKTVNHWIRDAAKLMPEVFTSHTNAYNTNRQAKLSKALKGQKELPAGYQITTYKGVKVVKGPKGLIPNQGVNDYVTRQDLIDNFYAWQALNTNKSLQ